MWLLVSKYRYYIFAALFVVYTFGVWHVSAKYTSSSYEKEKAELAIAAKNQLEAEQERSTIVGRQAAEAQLKVDQLQSELAKRTYREIQKPVYNECFVTDDGLRILNEAIGNRRNSSE